MKIAVVVCPGRGTYNKAELGYLARHHAHRSALFAGFEAVREARGREPLLALDSAGAYSIARHSRGDNASVLIYASTFGDFLSIDLGGMLVLAGNEAGLSAFEKAVPLLQGRFPMRLANHAAFHTALQAPVAEAGRARLSPVLFVQPSLPLVDGRGAIWWPHATDTESLRDYTLGHQVVETYDFTRALRTAAREFAPDLLIVTGPGTTLGGAAAQSLVLANWRGMATKMDFVIAQESDPLLISMGMEEQRSVVTIGGKGGC